MHVCMRVCARVRLCVCVCLRSCEWMSAYAPCVTLYGRVAVLNKLALQELDNQRGFACVA